MNNSILDLTAFASYKGKTSISVDDAGTGLVIATTKANKYDGALTEVAVKPSTEYHLNFSIPEEDWDAEKDPARVKYGYTNQAGTLLFSGVSKPGKYHLTFKTGSEQTSTRIYLMVVYRDTQENSKHFMNLTLTEKIEEKPVEPEISTPDLLSEIDELTKKVNSLEASLAELFRDGNIVADVDADNYSIKGGEIRLKRWDKTRIKVLDITLKEDAYLTALNVFSGKSSARIFVNSKQIVSRQDIFEYALHKGDKVTFDITSTADTPTYLYIGRRRSQLFNFLDIDGHTCYISNYGSDSNSGYTPFNPKKTAPFGDGDFDRFLFNGSEVFCTSYGNARGYIGSYGGGQATFDSLKEFEVTKNEAGEYTCILPHIPGFIRFNELDMTWDCYGEGWPTTYGSYYPDKSIFGKEDSYYCKSVDEGYELHLTSSRELTKIYAPTLDFAFKLSSGSTIENMIIKNYNKFAINAHGTGQKLVARYITASFIGGGFYSNNCRYGNGIQFNTDGNDCLIEDCIAHDIFDAGFTMQSTGGGENNLIRRCRCWNAFWPFEAYAQNNITFEDCAAYNSRDLSNGYRGVNASTRNSLFLVWASESDKYTTFKNCYGAYSTGDGLYIGQGTKCNVENCKIYGTSKKSKNTYNSILAHDGNEGKYAEALSLGLFVTSR